MHRATLTDAELAYDITGKRGPLVVQLHGLTSSRKRDAQIGLDLGRALRDHRILRYDARGHGSSTGSPEAASYTWPRLAGDLLALLDQLAPGEPVHGVGTSMGSATLLHAALRAPDRFASLTLVVPPTAWETRKAQAQRYLANADVVEAHGIEAFVELGATVPDPPALAGAPQSLPSVEESLLPSVMRGAATSNLPPLQEVAELAVPTLILGWADDPSHPVRTAELLHAAIANSRRVVARTPYGIMAWPALFADHVTAADEQRRARLDDALAS
ncbi:alpha/beta fold hydrolase [Micropruina sonneratiae]|uniref:alpha/beta fold hydrolase n=1 Tax=Micropruina sonneratiae TaxID=2986940 RepID=UPI0022270682|nr:alpha/beta hydrolase [Micropruina sp. KQZ13P-5]MCW3158718.1 alpha/beta hydrolase [Micropruina sp. KQZ13P-5]